MDRHREEEPPGRRSMLRAFVDRLRSRADARRRRAEIEQGRHLPGEPIILSEEGSREVLDEIRNGSPLTPERRAMFERIRVREAVRKRQAEIEQGRHFPGEPIILSEEGSREVIDEIINGSPLTPERWATFERMRLMAEVHRYSEGLLEPSDDPYRRTPPLSLEGSREVEEEMARPPADTPERRALFERVRVRAAMRARVAEMQRIAQEP